MSRGSTSLFDETLLRERPTDWHSVADESANMKGVEMQFRHGNQPVINVQISIDDAWDIWFHAYKNAEALAAQGSTCIAEEAMEMADRFGAIYDDLYAQHQIEKQLASA